MAWSNLVRRARAALGIAHGSRAFGPPLQVSLSLTNRCNIRCVHCWYHSPLLDTPNTFGVRRARQTETPPPDDSAVMRLDAEARKTAALVDQAIGMGIPTVQFDANGEPFLHPDAVDLMARARAGGRRCVTYTNGTLLTDETVDALVDMQLDLLCVTTLAGTPEAYDLAHPDTTEGMFRRVRDGLLYLAERKRARGARRPRIRMQCTVIKQTIGGLADFARFARAVEADLVTFRPIDDIGDATLAALRPSEQEADRAEADLREAAAFLDGEGVPHNVGAHPSVLWRQRDTSALYRAIPCYYGWLGMKVDPDGSVYPCCRCYESLGNAHEDGLSAVWYGEGYRRFRREAGAINKRGSPVDGCQCNGCSQPIANLRAFRALHPVRGRTKAVRRLDSGAMALPDD